LILDERTRRNETVNKGLAIVPKKPIKKQKKIQNQNKSLEGRGSIHGIRGKHQDGKEVQYL
jgi:hypothetical protein